MLIIAGWLLSLKYSKMFSTNSITSYTVARNLGHIWDNFFWNTFEQHLFHSLLSSPRVPIGVWKCFPMPSSPDLGNIVWFTVWTLRALHPEIFVCWSRLCCSQKCVISLCLCRPRGEWRETHMQMKSFLRTFISLWSVHLIKVQLKTLRFENFIISRKRLILPESAAMLNWVGGMCCCC